MPNIKGIQIVNIRNIFRSKPSTFEKDFIASLPEHLKTLYLTAVTNTWTAEEIQNEFYIYAANALFPNDPDQFVKLGQLVADASYKSIYKFFLRIPTPAFVIKNWVNIWFLHHDSGKPSYENFTESAIDLIITDFPSLPFGTRHLISGNMLKVMEIINLKNYGVLHIDDNSKAWRWHCFWQ